MKVFAKEPEVNCPAPRSPDHGQTFLYQDGSVVKYVCDPGYTLIGRGMIRCIDGQWEEPIPLCLEVSGKHAQISFADMFY
ncbi:hypothetical protein AVEN_232842-1 [Araneus ventricosus]|uniref:Sushi domain-containing protein n=1 Tax=Araneus ventricosus TaxID=182803 RepID=A0A4Y2TNA2_ARAVE|nr:hypothetical protein AVEN_232842-1 [Araneus ventricosus]